MIETEPALARRHRPADAWPHRHLLDVDALSRAEVERCLDLGREMRQLHERGDRLDALAGHVVGLAFAEASTRTRVSFEIAAGRLGAQVVELPVEASSVTKGESLTDTLRTLERTGVGTVVLRHAASGAPYLAARATGLRVVNAGDGAHAHPTQALLDALTLVEALDGLDGRTVTIVGDLAHSRVARSNLHLLQLLGARVRLAGPPAWVGAFRSWDGVDVTTNLEEALDGTNAVMALRVQLERDAGGGVPSLREYARRWGLDESRMRRAAPGAPLLHPGPTNEGVEVSADLAAGPRSLIGRQVANGVAVRMAVLALLAQ
ncbi:MAG TPA: aspartate carbamoyltransferase catalytic subunit [Candidatus Limnocylindria bacterium]|nr:aspartate carbamoyltransferase catalytic subunit [Candidatus Limnocylindria bacterium]